MSSAIGVAQGGGAAAHGCVRAMAELASVSRQLTCFMREELRRRRVKVGIILLTVDWRLSVLAVGGNVHSRGVQPRTDPAG